MSDLSMCFVGSLQIPLDTTTTGDHIRRSGLCLPRTYSTILHLSAYVSWNLGFVFVLYFVCSSDFNPFVSSSILT